MKDAILSVLKGFDCFLLHKCERFCHLFQRLTGKNNFYLAKACLLMKIAMGVTIISLPIGRQAAPFLLVMPMVFIYFIFSIILYNEACSFEEQAGKHWKDAAYRNPLELKFVWLRLLMIVFGLVLSSDSIVLLILRTAEASEILRLADKNIWTLYYYLVSCSPLPPQNSKLMELLGRIRATLTPPSSSVTEPV